eukprot:TRINITY_DN77661_c0_g1_i1.p1 TRINITY_DN77661_c0_g1~~TRINITY_DN77661_c0_g1_i1.p1  ORF type:complete len:207 (-),score=47.07 TRINITY_DN77661_c0_g1_i1:92-643(-)
MAPKLHFKMMATAMVLLGKIVMAEDSHAASALDMDDECRVDDSNCGLEALQLRAVAESENKPCEPAEVVCKGKQGKDLLICTEKQSARCCIFNGGSARACCYGKSAAVAREGFCKLLWVEEENDPVCKNTIAQKCEGCSGKGCDLCKEEEQVKCCIHDGGAVTDCCRGTRWEIRGKKYCGGEN